VKTYTLYLSQPIINFSSVVIVSQAKTEIKRAYLEFEAAKQDLIVRVAELYMEALAAQDALAFAIAEQTTAAQYHELARTRHSVGLALITDLHDPKARPRPARVPFLLSIQEVWAFSVPMTTITCSWAWLQWVIGSQKIFGQKWKSLTLANPTSRSILTMMRVRTTSAMGSLITVLT